MSEPKYQFIVNKGPQPGKIFVMMTDTVSLGRDPMADISLNDPEVSRQHAQLTKTASGFVIEDLGSTNGTFINGDQLESGVATPLADGDIVSIGSGISMVFTASNDDSEPEPTQDEFDEMFGEFSPEVPEEVGTAVDDPIIDHSPELPDYREAEEAEPAAHPLVPPANEEKARKRRRNIIIGITAVVLLCCCCLLFFGSAYYYWGDPLIEYLGIY